MTVPAIDATDPAVQSPVPPPARTWHARCGRLFPAAPARPVRAGQVAAATGLVLLGAAVNLGRVGGAGAFNSIWAEDGTNFLTDALNKSTPRALITPFNGYYHLGPRLLAEVAAQVPVAWAPAVLSVEASVVIALCGLAAFVASAAHLRSLPARLLVSVPVVVLPIAENVKTMTSGEIATLQFFALYAVFWMLLWSPSARLGRTIAVVVVGLTAFSTLLIAIFLPLALVRLYVRRDLPSVLMAGLATAGTAVHVTALALGWTVRPDITKPRLDPLWALGSLVGWAVPQQVIGYRWLGIPEKIRDHLVLMAVAWLIVAVVVVLATQRLTRPDWLLAAVAAAHGVVLALVGLLSSGRLEERYLVTPGLLTLVAVAALLRPGPGLRGVAPLAGYAVLLAVLVVVNYRLASYRTISVPWDRQLSTAEAACRADPALPRARIWTTWPDGAWHVVIPCQRLR